MDLEIAFTLNKITGHLSVMDRHFPPTSFHIYSDGRYLGQLLYQQQQWRLPDSPLSPYKDYLSNIVELWYDSQNFEIEPALHNRGEPFKSNPITENMERTGWVVPATRNLGANFVG